MFEKVLVANRGEIARRICRSLTALGVGSAVVHSPADRDLPFVREAQETVEIADVPPAMVYRQSDRIIQAARRIGAEAVHPGYGFLSENPEFAEEVLEQGLAWIGPDPATIRLLGDKAGARDTMADAGLPVSDGGLVESLDEATRLAGHVGFPVLLKAVAGGGGMGIRVVEDATALPAAYGAVEAQAQHLFGDGRILLETYLPMARHIEVQVMGLADSRIVTFQERECSVQRRFQKVLEETPSPAVDPPTRARMAEAARAGMAAIGYRNAGTVEYIYRDGHFVFLEVNARLQVEHPITELVTGVDLVAEQVRVAAGEPPGFDVDGLRAEGHAIELRVNAEDPVRFLPSPGTLTRWVEPDLPEVRVDAGYTAGNTVTPHYDPLLAKVCVWGASRVEAIQRAAEAAAAFSVEGIKTNIPFLTALLNDQGFNSGAYDTGIVQRMAAVRSGT